MSTELRELSSHRFSSQVFDSSATQGGGVMRFQELARYRFLLRNLIVRDLKVRYRNSILGILWSLLNPLMMMLVYTVLFTILIPDGAIRQYPVFILVGLIPWNFLSGSLIGGTVSISENAQLVKKVYFPRMILPMAVLLSNLVHFLLAFLVLLVFLYVYGIGLTVVAMWIPLILFTQLIFTLGLSMLLSAVHTFYRDVMMILNVALLAWFFLTPVFYPFERLGDSATLFGITFVPAVVMRWINPMASIIDSYRTVLWGTVGSIGPGNMDVVFLLRTFFTSVIVFIIGYTVFTRTEHLFGEKL
jgi:ABC-type polysaccharide/polyol phosphate export permease